MKRDMDLVRELLLQTEKDLKDFEVEGYDLATVLGHLTIMEEAGLIEAQLQRNKVERLTWAGHDFLDAARSEEIWNQTKKVVAEKTGSISFELLKLALVEGAKVALRQAGLPI